MDEVTDLLGGLAETMDMLSNDADQGPRCSLECATQLVGCWPSTAPRSACWTRNGGCGCSVASDEIIGRIEVLEHALGEGPCTDMADEETPVVAGDQGALDGDRWPRFASAAVLAGMHTVAGWPVRDGPNVVGALCLFSQEPFGLSDVDAGVAPLLAAIAGACVADHRRRAHAERTIGQLQDALNHHVVIEQAKGMLSVQLGTSVGQAFELLRRHARNHNQRAVDVAREVASGQRLFDEPDRGKRR